MDGFSSTRFFNQLYAVIALALIGDHERVVQELGSAPHERGKFLPMLLSLAMRRSPQSLTARLITNY